MGDAYRDQLNDFRAQAHDAVDAALLKLSAGALGLSFAFLRQFVGDVAAARWAWLLYCAWGLWAACSMCVLWSFHYSGLAMDRAIEQYDGAHAVDGGRPERVTRFLNGASKVTFTLGLVFAVVFMIGNARGGEMSDYTEQANPRHRSLDQEGPLEQRGRLVPTQAPPKAESSAPSGSAGQSESASTGNTSKS